MKTKSSSFVDKITIYSLLQFTIVTIYLVDYIIIYLFSVETYLSPVETHCMNVDYFFLDPENQTHEFSEDAMTRLRMFDNNYSNFQLVIVLKN